MHSSVDELLERNLLRVFSERDATKRREALQALWLPEGVFMDPDGRYVGLDAINRRVAELQAMFLDFVFVARGPANVMHEVGRLAWGFGPEGGSAAVTGVDVAVTCDGRLLSLYAFIDP
jgi:hypothetical protein